MMRSTDQMDVVRFAALRGGVDTLVEGHGLRTYPFHVSPTQNYNLSISFRSLRSFRQGR
jgi:hypothetical protein